MTVNGDSALLLTTVGIELVAAAAFLCVPLAIAILRRSRPDLPEPKLLWLLSLFVGLVGLTYILDALGQLAPPQMLGRWAKIATSVTSLAALVLVYPAARRLLALPSRQLLEDANRELAAQFDRAQRANEVIALSEARYRLLVDTASEGIWILDRIGRITFSNPRITEMLGFSPEQLKGMTLLDVVPEEDRASVVDALQRHRRGLAVRGTRRLLNSNGAPVPVHMSSSPMMDKGEFASILGVVTDLSEQMTAHEELQRLAAELEDRVTQRTQAYRETAAQLAATLEVSRFQSRNYGMLQQMADMLQSCTTPFEAARVGGEFAVKLFDADAGTIYTMNQETGAFTSLHTWGASNESAEQVVIDDCWALRQNKLYPNSVNQFTLRCNHLRLGPTRNTCCLPMSAHGQAAGLINLRRGAPFVSSDVEASAEFEKVAQLFAANIAQFLSNLALRRSLEQQSLRDPLTNLFNRRYFNEQLAIEFERAHRSRSPLALQMVDIDHFKRINDRFGHEAGDRVLRMVSDILQQNARSGDIVCRWGGEEFLILMPGSNATAAKRRADEIRSRVNDQIEIVGGTRVSVSIGVASFPDHASDPDGLIDVSDRALYAAKGAGRNRVTVAVAVL
ncbi:MAG: diguanylate cyclase [Lautropia sp.]|nr:diguanylate cyclase [Lautropia sp.]